MCRSHFTPWSLHPPPTALRNAASFVPQRSIFCCAREQSLLSNKIESLQISQLRKYLSLVGSRCQQHKKNAQNDYPEKPHNTLKARLRAVA